MQATADQIALVLENAQLYAKLEETKKALENELDKGRQIQKNFLPDELPQIPKWEFAAFFQPAREVAGDFYDVFLLPGDNENVGLVIADVCDKGVGAALFMALFRSLIRIFSGQTSLEGLAILANYELSKPDLSRSDSEKDAKMATQFDQMTALRAVSLTNNYIAQTHCSMGMFATLFFGVLNPKTGLLTYINGGHEAPVILSSDGTMKRLTSTGPAVGMMPDVNFKVYEVQLQPGDILFSYTDGVPEARNPNREFFTDKRLLSLLEEPTSSATALVQKIEENLSAHIADVAQFDDITMLAVRWVP